METIGFVGLGHMGGNMAARLLDAGYDVYGTARVRDSAQWLLEKGLRWLDTPREIADAADIVLTSLPDDAVVQSVAGGRDGLLAGMGAGKVWADMSTVSPRRVVSWRSASATPGQRCSTRRCPEACRR